MLRVGLVVVLVLLGGRPVLADLRGSEERIDRYLTLYYKNQRDPKVVTELGANYAVKYADTGTDQDMNLAKKYLNEAAKLDPNGAAALAWLGLVQCLEARNGVSLEAAQRGLDRLDWALNREPDNLDLRVLRATVGLEAPREFNRIDQAIADLEYVGKRLRENPALSRQVEIDPSEVHHKLGLGFRAKGDIVKARQAWEAAVKSGPETLDGKKAAKLLKKHPAPRE
ncbi:MAG: hypothetical protein HY815_21020 [Candidatus Riflebacteria bacterium]|nr:hypothetical protein [Candidatus Riflebacteria bacterium]